MNAIVGYWLDCIRQEDVLAKEISINVRTKAVLFPFAYDPYIFHRESNEVVINDSRIIEFLTKTKLANEEVYYGYPILLYYDEKTGKHNVAPFFIIKLDFKKQKDEIFLFTDESIPNCGINALQRIGLRTEEIASINQEFEKLFKSNLSDSKTLVNKCLSLLLEETNFSINEEIDPQQLSDKSKLSKNTQIGLYNKCLIFSGENTLFNMGVIKDLIKLKSSPNIKNTALSFIKDGNVKNKTTFNQPLVLPYSMNDYQISALKSVFNNKMSVITGPPGTGKSQFIMNLLINLYLNNKTVLFVSHTNEAVDVVNEKINQEFRNLLFRTGNKELRQGLLQKFEEIKLEGKQATTVSSPSERKWIIWNRIERISIIWKRIIEIKKTILILDNIEAKFSDLLEVQKLKFGIVRFIIIRLYLWKLKKLPEKNVLVETIKELEMEYFSLSKEYVNIVFRNKIANDWVSTHKAKNFLMEVEKTKFHEEINSNSFINALDLLKIWSSTLKSINRTFPMQAGVFDYVVFDESSQIDLPSAAPALYRAKNAVIVGDPMQLTHIAGITKDLDSSIAQSYNLHVAEDLYPSRIRYYDISLYRCAESLLGYPPTMLIKHYRSEDQIINLCNDVFYSGQLKVSSSLDYQKWPVDIPIGIQWKNCEGCTIKPPNGSRVNKEEACKVNEIFQEILNKIKNTKLTVGIVTPYSQQQKLLTEIIYKNTPEELLEKHDVKILTAHRFQGSEKDIMIFSVVLASTGDGNSDRWYNSNPQILNVALSRAKYLLYIVGDKKFCSQGKGILKRIHDSFEKIKNEEDLEEQYFSGNFDSKAEMLLYKKMQKINFEMFNYKLIPKFIDKRYTLDFALLGSKKIDIECDGFGTHNIIDGLPVLEDVERDDYLKNKGWIVLRFPNHKILTDIKSVINQIIYTMQNN